jgi:hypothetical protein
MFRNFDKSYKSYGGKTIEDERRPIRSKYIGFNERRRILKILERDAEQRGSSWTGLRDRIKFAQKRNDAFEGFQKIETK